MRTLLVCVSLLLAAAAAAPAAEAGHVQCADDPITRPPCEVVAAVLNCVIHRLDGQPCSAPPPLP